MATSPPTSPLRRQELDDSPRQELDDSPRQELDDPPLVPIDATPERDMNQLSDESTPSSSDSTVLLPSRVLPPSIQNFFLQPSDVAAVSIAKHLAVATENVATQNAKAAEMISGYFSNQEQTKKIYLEILASNPDGNVIQEIMRRMETMTIDDAQIATAATSLVRTMAETNTRAVENRIQVGDEAIGHRTVARLFRSNTPNTPPNRNAGSPRPLTPAPVTGLIYPRMRGGWGAKKCPECEVFIGEDGNPVLIVCEEKREKHTRQARRKAVKHGIHGLTIFNSVL